MKLLKTSIIGLMILLLAEMAFASSQESPPLRQGEPEEFNTPNDTDKNIKSRNNKTIAPKSILTNNNEKTVPSEESHSYPSSNPKSNTQFSTSKDDPIVRYTFWLTVFTGGLVFFNCLLWLFTVFLWQSTKKTADAATLNAKALIGMERPYLRLYHLNFGDMGVAGIAAKLQYPKIEIIIKNYGRTPAFLTHKAIEFRFQESLPDIPVYQHIYPLTPSEVIQYDQVYKLVERPLDGDFWYQWGIDSTSTISDWQHSMRKVMEERKRFWIYGFIAYEDFLDISHRFCFCRQFILKNDFSEGHSFIECDNPKYNENY